MEHSIHNKMFLYFSLNSIIAKFGSTLHRAIAPNFPKKFTTVSWLLSFAGMNRTKIDLSIRTCLKFANSTFFRCLFPRMWLAKSSDWISMLHTWQCCFSILLLFFSILKLVYLFPSTFEINGFYKFSYKKKNLKKVFEFNSSSLKASNFFKMIHCV